MGEAEKCLSAPILNIDHHVSNTRYADYLLLDDQAAATGEIMYLMLEENGVPVDQELATDLYTAIVTDCGYFKYANTTPRCMRWGRTFWPGGEAQRDFRPAGTEGPEFRGAAGQGTAQPELLCRREDRHPGGAPGPL